MSFEFINQQSEAQQMNVWHQSIKDEMYEMFCDTVEKFELLNGIENIVFLFSGGKDATFALYLLNRYIKDNSLVLPLKAVMITYPTHVYFEKDGSETDNFKEVTEFWRREGVEFLAFQSNRQDLAEGDVDGCKICKGARKELVDTFLDAVADKETTALVTGYTLGDILAYLNEYCLVSNFNFDISSFSDDKTVRRITNCLHKMNIKEVLPNGFRLIRPLVVFKENDILHYLKENQIPYINRPCKVAPFKHKRAYFNVLNLVESINHTTYEGILGFLSKHNVKFPEQFDDISYSNFFTDC